MAFLICGASYLIITCSVVAIDSIKGISDIGWNYRFYYVGTLDNAFCVINAFGLFALAHSFHIEDSSMKCFSMFSKQSSRIFLIHQAPILYMNNFYCNDVLGYTKWYESKYFVIYYLCSVLFTFLFSFVLGIVITPLESYLYVKCKGILKKISVFRRITPFCE